MLKFDEVIEPRYAMLSSNIIAFVAPPMKKITSSNFEEEVTRAEGPILLDFGAAWCGPCKLIEPVLLKLETSWQGKVAFGKVDVDESPDLAHHLRTL